MKKTTLYSLYALWVCLYITCVGMGSLTQRTTALSVVLTILSLLFFVPPYLLLWHSFKADDKKTRLIVRTVSLVSLVLTLSLVVINIMAVQAGDTVGQLLNDLLLVVSAPMFCCYIRGVSIFLWACLFVSSFPRIWKK